LTTLLSQSRQLWRVSQRRLVPPPRTSQLHRPQRADRRHPAYRTFRWCALSSEGCA